MLFIGRNYYLLLALLCFGLAYYVFFRFKPHPAEKHFIAYKNGNITRQMAIKKISSVMYNPTMDGLPSARKSKAYEERIQALRKRVNAETAFIDDLRKYIKAKSRVRSEERRVGKACRSRRSPYH